MSHCYSGKEDWYSCNNSLSRGPGLVSKSLSYAKARLDMFTGFTFMSAKMNHLKFCHAQHHHHQSLELPRISCGFWFYPYWKKGYYLYVDNFYTSLPLFKALYKHKTVACGTIRSNRKGFPKALAQKKLTFGMSHVLRCDELLALKFKDKKDVHMLSTMHNSACTTVNVRSKNHRTMDKPHYILSYNRKIGGVDKSDQLIEPYDATRKS